MLRTSSELTRHDVRASDGDIGSVADLLFDDRSWTVGAIVVDTGACFSQRKVLISPASILDLDFPSETMILRISKQQVEALPDFAATPRTEGGNGDEHLRSSKEAGIFQVFASDAEMGQVHGFVIETSTWTIRYLIVDTGEWLMGKLVLLRPDAIQSIDWTDRSMTTNVTADDIRHSPVYDERAELSRDYEAFLHDYYGWPHYWL
jgi:uncharacterized protein YrrD